MTTDWCGSRSSLFVTPVQIVINVVRDEELMNDQIRLKFAACPLEPCDLFALS